MLYDGIILHDSSKGTHMTKVLCTIVFMAIISTGMNAQVRIGATTGWFSGTATGDIKVVTGNDQCNCPTVENSDYVRGADAGIVVEVDLVKSPSVSVGLMAVASHGWMNLRMSAPGDKLPSIDSDGNPVQTSLQHNADLNMQLAGGGIGLTMTAAVGLKLGALVRCDVPYATDFSTSIVLADPSEGTVLDPSLVPGAYYSADGRAVFTRYHEELDQVNTPQVSVEPSIAWTIPLAPVSFEPFIAARVPINDLDARYKIRITSYQVGLRVMIGL